MHCWKCGTEITDISGARKVLKTDSCPNCQFDLHACRNCRFYDLGAHNECQETQAEWVRDKEKANYCDYFEPKKTSSQAIPTSSTDNVKSALDKLFRD